MPLPLEYGRPRRRPKLLAISALVGGICSGPVGCGLAALAVYNSLSESTKDFLALAGLLIALGGALGFSCFARMRLNRTASNRDRLIANIAIAAPIIWTGFIFAYVFMSSAN